MTNPTGDVYLISELDLSDPAAAAMALNQLLHQISERLGLPAINALSSGVALGDHIISVLRGRKK